MFAFLLPLLIGSVVAAPQQGYDYRVQIGSTDTNNGNSNGHLALTEQQYHQLVQQYQEQQLSQQQTEQTRGDINESANEAAAAVTEKVAPLKTVEQSGSNGGYQFANQLVQQAQQLVQYEQQQQQPKPQEATVKAAVKPTLPAVEALRPGLINNQLEEEEVAVVPEVQQQRGNLPVIDAKVLARPQSTAAANDYSQQSLATITQQLVPATPAPSYYNGFRIEPQSNSVQYNKEFFFHAAPQEEFDQSKQAEDALSIMKKNIRVVFIKAPEQNGLEKAALQLAKQSIDQQTAIYVLTKQHDVNDLAHKLQDLRAGTPQAKPEVVFVKYKTPEEAEQAQRTIQAQYENLDGPNSYNRAGHAATHNFIGSLGIDPRAGSGFRLPAAQNAATNVNVPASTYLPPLAKRRL